MSTNSNKPNTNEEVDLGQLFKLIGNAFDRFFNFIYNIFKSFFLAFVWLVFFVKKRIIILVLASVFGFVYGLLNSKSAAPKYESSVIVVQNYPTGENLYNSVSYYNDLVRQGDFQTLGIVLNLGEEKAQSILSFEVEPVVSENDKLLAFNNYVQKLDSLASTKIEYEDFLLNNEDHTHKYQQVKISSTQRNNFKSVFESIVETINSNPFFKNEQYKDIAGLNKTKEGLELALVKSDSLQSTYKRVLEQGLNSDKASEIGITFEGSGETDKTKEYDLYQSDLVLRSELVEVERELLDKQFIIEAISNKQDSGFASNTKEFFGNQLSVKLYFTVVLFLSAFIILLGLEFFKFLEKYKTAV